MNHERRWFFWCGLALLLASVGLLLVLADRRILLLARNSLWVGLGACAVAVPVGTFAGAGALSHGPARSPTVFWLVASLLFLPLYLHAAAWDAGFGQLGWYSAVRESVRAPLLQGVWAVMWIHGLWSVPWVTLIVSAVLHWSEPELEEAALLDATHAQVFFRVTLRRAVPGVITASVWVMLVAIGEIVVTDLYQVRTLAEELYTGYALGDDMATTMGLRTALLLTGALTGAAMMVLDRLMVFTQQVPRRTPLVFRLGRWRWPVHVCWWLWCCCCWSSSRSAIWSIKRAWSCIKWRVFRSAGWSLGPLPGTLGALAVDLSVCSRVGVPASAVVDVVDWPECGDA